MMTYLYLEELIIGIAVGSSVGAILLIAAIFFGLKRCRRTTTPRNSMAHMVEDSSSGHPSVAIPQSPHLSHQSSFPGPQLAHTPQPPSLSGPPSPPPYHRQPSFADHPLSHPPHLSQSFGSGASSALYSSPNALQLGGNLAHTMGPSSPNFLFTAPSNGYSSHAQHHSHYGAIPAAVPASDYAWTPGNTGNEVHDSGQGLDEHRSPRFGMSPTTGAQNLPGPNQSPYPASQAGNW